MSRTKLEVMVGLLAGRDVDPALLDELADPSSESSRFLEATRLRSRALLGDSALVHSSLTAAHKPSRWTWILVLASAAILFGLASTAWWIDRRLQIVEARFTLRDREERSENARIAASLAKSVEASPPTGRLESLEASLERIEADLARVDRKPIREEVASILERVGELRLELSAREKMETRRTEELQSSVHETARLLRLLLNRTDALPSSGERPSAEPRRKTP